MGSSNDKVGTPVACVALPAGVHGSLLDLRVQPSRAGVKPVVFVIATPCGVVSSVITVWYAAIVQVYGV